MNRAWIALGSNLGDRASNLRRAVELLGGRGLSAERVSHLYETRPEGGREEPPYLNAVLTAPTPLEPEPLLRLLHEVEGALGRNLQARAGPRTLDLDLLSLGNLVCQQTPALQLPHPRLHLRTFVLVPLCELDVHWRHPILGETAGDLLAMLPAVPGAVRLFGEFPALSGVEPLLTTHTLPSSGS